MDLSEILQSVKDAVSGVWERASFLIRSHALASLLVFALLVGGLVWWGSTGFSLQIGQFFAADLIPRTTLRAGDNGAFFGLDITIGNGPHRTTRLSWETFPNEVFSDLTGITVSCGLKSDDAQIQQTFTALSQSFFRTRPKGAFDLKTPMLFRSFKVWVACSVNATRFKGGTLTKSSWTSNTVTVNDDGSTTDNIDTGPTTGATPVPTAGTGGGSTGGGTTSTVARGISIPQCNPLTGNGKLLTDWHPQVTPNPVDPSSALPPCAPLSVVDNMVFPGFSIRSFDPVTEVWSTPVPPVPPQKDWAKCLVVLDRRSESPSFSAMSIPGVLVSGILRENPDAKLFYKALVINNCPWTVRLQLQADGDADTMNDVGVGKRQRPISDGEMRRTFSRDPVTVGDFPSCWNNGSGYAPLSCGREVTIEYRLNTYTCGSVGLALKWWHFTNNNTVGEYTPDDPALKRDISGTVNYGVVCTGAAGERQPGTLGGFPVDPSGACVFEERFNAPDGAWFCEDLKCNLAGNPPFEPTEARKPPSGPASRINIHVMGANPQPVDPSLGPVFIRYILDATPKNGNLEGYPPKDPLWSCSRADGVEVDLGRNGHDYYQCYNPVIRLYDYEPVTCCANTGLDGDCFTWSVPRTGSVTPAPGQSTSPGPGTSVSPSSTPDQVQCAPLEQTVETNATARLQASGGNGTFSWNVGGGSLVEDNGSSIGVRFGVSGTKTVRVTSQGTTASCTVRVVIPEATVAPSPSESTSPGISPSTGASPSGGASATPIPSGIYVTPVVSNGTTITPGPGTADSDGDGIPDRTECPDPYRCPDSSGDGVADWQDTGVRNRVGRVLSASEVPTGPGEATVLALIISALVSLLYITYTHSPLGIRHEAKAVSKDQPPMDFRN